MLKLATRTALAAASVLALSLVYSTSALADPPQLRTQLGLQYKLQQEDLENASERLVKHGMSYVGVRYRFGGTSRESGLDCSGLVLNVFKHEGVSLPRRAADMARVGIKVDKNDLQPGDLVFFNTRKQPFSHVGLYIGDGKFLHAPSSGGQVRVENMSTRYWLARYNGARRLISDDQSG